MLGLARQAGRDKCSFTEQSSRLRIHPAMSCTVVTKEKHIIMLYSFISHIQTVLLLSQSGPPACSGIDILNMGRLTKLHKKCKTQTLVVEHISVKNSEMSGGNFAVLLESFPFLINLFLA